jgi:alpha-galactosidase
MQKLPSRLVTGVVPPVLALLMLLFSLPAHSLVVAPEERAEVERFVAAKFEGRLEKAPDEGYLIPELMSGVLEKNSRQSHGLRIASASFAHGFNIPSSGAVRVHLPAPVERFTAVIGVDSNDITYYSSLGRGQVVVTVEVGGKEVFRSRVMREGMAGIPIDIDLKGATDFILRVRGAAQHDPWTQVDFGGPKAVLADRKEVDLEDLPIGPLRANYTLDPPFSFVYGGIKSQELLPSWSATRETKKLDASRTEYRLVYSDPKTGLVVRCVGVAYGDFPTIEWTLYFKNTGKTDTPILEHIQALDTRFERNGDGEFLLHHSKGAPATPNDYEPYETSLGPKASIGLSAAGGRPTNRDLSYFNLQWPGQGVIIVVGWPGQWTAQLDRDTARGIQVRAGQQLTHFKLLPGEEVRSPLIVLQFWSGDWLRSQNLWRRWMIAHNVPRPGGKLPPPQMAGNTSREYVEMTEATDTDENMFIDLYLKARLKPDYFWMDAGWYLNNGSWTNVGTWEVDPKRFPHGLRAVSDHAHADGVKIIVWFEPERVTPGTWLYEHHPEWLLNAPPNPGGQSYNSTTRLFNFGDPEARRWMTDHVDALITSQGIDLYRQDFNMDPLYFWRANDAPDRQGITEIRYVTGYLAYWDELRRRHPNMLIDSCASGGRRNDLETLRRAVPLTRSDYLLEPGEPISQQMQTYGISLWIPFFGTGISGTDRYVFRSQMTPAIITSWDLRRNDLNLDDLRTLIAQWREIAPDYYGDYYPLTPYSLDPKVWAVMQFDRPDTAGGFVEAFRRSGSPYESARLKLQGLVPEGHYQVVNLDQPGTAGTQEFLGRDLMNEGMQISLKHAPDSQLLVYRRTDESISATK